MNNSYFNAETIKLLTFGILTPFLVHLIIYIMNIYGLIGYFYGYSDNRSVKLMAVLTSSSIQILESVFFIDRRKIFFRVARGKANIILIISVIPVALIFFFVLYKMWDKFNRFGSVYLSSPSGIVNGVFYQFMVYFVSYITFVCVFGLWAYIKIQIKRRNHGGK